jgi:hypothetical protein
MRGTVLLTLLAGCYRGPDPSEPQPQPLAYYTPGEAPPPAQIAARGPSSANDLILLGSQTATFDTSHANAYDRICVQDSARIASAGSYLADPPPKCWTSRG